MKFAHKILAGTFIGTVCTLASAQAVVGVSWSNFQEER